jgi:hypothetical protein
MVKHYVPVDPQDLAEVQARLDALLCPTLTLVKSEVAAS